MRRLWYRGAVGASGPAIRVGVPAELRDGHTRRVPATVALSEGVCDGRRHWASGRSPPPASRPPTCGRPVEGRCLGLADTHQQGEWRSRCTSGSPPRLGDLARQPVDVDRADHAFGELAGAPPARALRRRLEIDHRQPAERWLTCRSAGVVAVGEAIAKARAPIKGNGTDCVALILWTAGSG
jgi:hypothetical protein